jgi:ChaC-like protein
MNASTERADTVAINRRMTHFDGHSQVWLFGYGSLIYKADFPHIERRPASIRGWARRFWLGQQMSAMPSPRRYQQSGIPQVRNPLRPSGAIL